MESATAQDARIRIQIAYIETPTLNLTLPQMRRLCELAPDVCEVATAALVASGFLTNAGDGTFTLRSAGRPADAILGPRSWAAAPSGR